MSKKKEAEKKKKGKKPVGSDYPKVVLEREGEMDGWKYKIKYWLMKSVEKPPLSEGVIIGEVKEKYIKHLTIGISYDITNPHGDRFIQEQPVTFTAYDHVSIVLGKRVDPDGDNNWYYCIHWYGGVGANGYHHYEDYCHFTIKTSGDMTDDSGGWKKCTVWPEGLKKIA
ncbi:MAG: hypothetical protein ACPGO5_05275 [Patescibacteria group bacterium]